MMFFVDWQLWEKLTFVLAMGIVVVFFVGWFKLWLMQRHLKKHTLLDEEKRARRIALGRSGLPLGRRVDIPFGVRAIQSGIEVDGIWISRPTSKASSTTLEADADTKREIKGDRKGKGVLKSTVTVTEVQPSPKLSPRPSPTRSVFERGTWLESNGESSPAATHIPEQQMSSLSSQSSDYFSYNIPHSNESIGQTARPARTSSSSLVETYRPTTSFSSITSSTSSHARLPSTWISSAPIEGNNRPGLRDMHTGHMVSHSPDYFNPSRLPENDTIHAQTGRSEPAAGPICYTQREDARTSHNLLSSPLPLASTRPMPVRTYPNTRPIRHEQHTNQKG
ncbi:hypothetical protein F5Y16DRAFT_56803 [Xylariaceae sp. FL0255]|nr:hypothetical protein F5Y16DRAFT_56803 [Xylariaceae sp. FL0255]